MRKEFLDKIKEDFLLITKYGIKVKTTGTGANKVRTEELVSRTRLPEDLNKEGVIQLIKESYFGTFPNGLLYLFRNFRIFSDSQQYQCYYMTEETSMCIPVDCGERFLDILCHKPDAYKYLMDVYSFWVKNDLDMIKDNKGFKSKTMTLTELFEFIYKYITEQKNPEFNISEQPVSFSNDVSKYNLNYFPRVDACPPPDQLDSDVREEDSVWWDLRYCFTSFNSYEYFMGFVGSIFNDSCRARDALVLNDEGSTGKTIIIREIAKHIKSMVFDASRLTDGAFKFSGVVGNRLLYNTDINLGKMLQNPDFKKLTSGDPLTYRDPYGKPRTEQNYLRNIFCTNENIQVNVGDRSENNRLGIVSLKYNKEIDDRYLKKWSYVEKRMVNAGNKVINELVDGSVVVEEQKKEEDFIVWRVREWEDALNKDFERSLPLFQYYYEKFYPQGQLNQQLIENENNNDLITDLGFNQRDFINKCLTFNDVANNIKDLRCSTHELTVCYKEYCKNNKIDFWAGIRHLKRKLKKYHRKTVRINKEIVNGYAGFTIKMLDWAGNRA